MATESPLIHDGAQTVAGFDGRNSSITGTTLAGPNGSAQFLAVTLSTSSSRTVAIPSSGGSTGAAIYGILQNKPSTGIAADVGIFGISKMVSGSTAIASGQDLMVSATAGGVLIPYSSTVGAGVARIARSLETATAVGQVFTGFVYGIGIGTIAATTA